MTIRTTCIGAFWKLDISRGWIGSGWRTALILRIPRPANQRRRRLARHHHGRREAAEREARVRHHVHAAGRLQVDAQPGGHDGDVVLAAPRLLAGPRMNWSPSTANQRIG